jgi:OOP family OmpA-OmpF porin
VAPDGCPAKDTDKDGFFDPDDQCREVPGVAPDGCPPPDTDGDGFIDAKDGCIHEPETKNGYEDEDGCPDEVPEVVREFTGVIAGIEFDFGLDEIRPATRDVLDRAIKILKEYPTILLEISGHTDNIGDRAANIDLSKRRAEAVRKYLIDGGIDASRLMSRGAGPDESIAPNDTEEGRAKNRRTEFKIVR